MNWLTLLLGKYQIAFNSPHSVEKCRRILLDYAQQAPFDYYSNETKVLEIEQKSDAPQVTMYKNLWTFVNKKDLSLIKFEGQIRLTPAGTRIVGQVSYTRGALRDIVAPLIFCAIFLIIIIWGLLLANPVPYAAVVIAVALLIGLGVAFFMPLYRLSRIPYYLLNDDDISSPIPLIWVKPEWIEREKKSWFSDVPFLKQENLFYTPLPIEKCVDILRQNAPISPYLTQWGTGESAQVDNLTVITYPQSEERVLFIIKDAEKKKHARYGQARAVGALIKRDKRTQVEWVVYNRMVERLFSALILILVLIGLSVIVNNMVMLPISVFIMGIFYWTILHTPLRIARYPQRLLSK
jgi:hypothetical protein